MLVVVLEDVELVEPSLGIACPGCSIMEVEVSELIWPSSVSVLFGFITPIMW